jgi:hypothetical protein
MREYVRLEKETINIGKQERESIATINSFIINIRKFLPNQERESIANIYNI